MKRLFIFILLAATICFSFPLEVIGQEGGSQVAYEQVNPKDIRAYKFKRLKEKVVLILKLSKNKKVDYQKDLLTKRLAELVYIVVNKDEANIEKASQRYEASAGKLTEYVLARDMPSRFTDVKMLMEEHKKIIEELKSSYPYHTAQYRFIVNDINSLDIYISKLTP